MNWLIAFRNELWINHPVFYTVLCFGAVCWLLRYVYKHEVRMNEEHKYSARRPFK